MKRLSTFLALMLLVMIPVVALAQDEAAEEKDALELGLRGGLGVALGGIKDWQDSLGAKGGLGYGVEFGYFLTPKLVLGGGFSFDEFSIDDKAVDLNMKHRVYAPYLYLKHYFQGESNWLPYAKVFAGADFVKFATVVTDGSDTKFRLLSYKPGVSMGLGGGLFYYTSDYGGLFLEANLRHGFTNGVTREYNGVEYKFDQSETAFEIRAGINVFFGSGS